MIKERERERVKCLSINKEYDRWMMIERVQVLGFGDSSS